MLELQRLSVEIAGKQVCRDLDLVLTRGQRWGLLGGNGVGKTTLLHTLAGLRAPQYGEIRLAGQSLAQTPPRTRARLLGLLLQEYDDPFPATVEETALIGRHPHLSPLAWESERDHALAREALARLQLDTLRRRSVTTLSGGERQRLAVATLLTQAPQVWLLDEPTNHLDLHHQIRLLDLIGERTRAGVVTLMTLHDVNLAARYCDNLLLLFGDGESLHGAATDVLTVANLQRLYRHPIVQIEGVDGPVFLPG